MSKERPKSIDKNNSFPLTKHANQCILFDPEDKFTCMSLGVTVKLRVSCRNTRTAEIQYDNGNVRIYHLLLK